MDGWLFVVALSTFSFKRELSVAVDSNHIPAHSRAPRIPLTNGKRMRYFFATSLLNVLHSRARNPYPVGGLEFLRATS